MTPTLHLVFIFPCEDCSLFVNCSVFQTIPEVLGRKGQVWLVIWIYFNIKFRSACITGAQSIAVGWETEKYYGFKFRYVTNSTVSSLSLSEKCSESVKSLSCIQLFVTPRAHHGILRQEYWAESRGSSRPRDGTWVSCMAGLPFTVWASREDFKVPGFTSGGSSQMVLVVKKLPANAGDSGSIPSREYPPE